MLEGMYRLCSEVLVPALAFPAGIPGSDPREVQQWFGARLERMTTEGRRLGVSGSDLAEARYALAAFIDERVLGSSWPGREEWMRQPLQLSWYGENAAGENFFKRLRVLLSAPERLPAVQVYGLCLALGFRGVYEANGDGKALAKFQRAAFRRLEPSLPACNVSSPHLATAQRLAPQRDQRPFWLALVVLSLLSGFVVVRCGWSVSRARDLAVTEIAGGSSEFERSR
jgi:type IV/VI secretion system ImpK/VasF family protein